MPFDLNGARQAGYSDPEIADYLAKQNDFNIGKARSAGYNDSELLNHLVATDSARASVEGPKGPQGLRAGPPPPPPMTTGEKVIDTAKNVVSGLGRPIAKAITSLPLTAMNAGIEARNFIQNPRIPTLADINPLSERNNNPNMPSAQFNQFLDSVSRPPTTPGGKATEFLNSVIAGGMVPGPSSLSSLTPPAVIQAGDTAALGGQLSTTYRPQALNAQILSDAQKEGYVAPPSSTNPTLWNRFREGLAGKAALTKSAQESNQAVTDRLSATAVGENSGAPVTPGALQAIRKQAYAQGYEPLKVAGSVPTDQKFVTDLNAINATAKSAEQTFPGIVPNSPISGVVDSLLRTAPRRDAAGMSSPQNVDIGGSLGTISHLREQADLAFRAGNGTLGKQYKQAATAVEDLIERGLQDRGQDGAKYLDAFRAARTQIAKTYTANKAAVGNGGQFDALTYASELARGKPLSGDQLQIANFAQNFGKYVKRPNGETTPSMSPIDVYGSATAAGATGSPVPFLYALTRPGLRAYMLSPAGQAQAMPNAMGQGVPGGILEALVRGMKPTSPAMIPLASRQAQNLFSE